ncbi:hypothetical protein ROA7450_04179 [Roseovarius albus]|uniref:Uncharacterized protein n=1 Tax=Roseovarius albus TaxID=1247867 RepID=A0A1X7A9G3_9RHOB|nr:hypothetical protein ROA7450_04179 [Roseovarius albus]
MPDTSEVGNKPKVLNAADRSNVGFSVPTKTSGCQMWLPQETVPEILLRLWFPCGQCQMLQYFLAQSLGRTAWRSGIYTTTLIVHSWFRGE